MSHPAPGGSSSLLLLLVSSRGPGGSCFSAILLQFFVAALHSVQSQKLVPDVSGTVFVLSGPPFWPPGHQLGLCPQVYFVSSKTVSQIQDWKKRKMAEDGFSLSHHIFLCLSTREPPFQIVSLNYCTQHIPVNRTHAHMHKIFHLANKSNLNAAFLTTHFTLISALLVLICLV